MIELFDLSIRYGQHSAVRHVNLRVEKGSVHAFIGPAGSGKTSILRTINLLSIEIDGASVEGRVLLDGTDLLTSSIHLATLRRRVGMVFASPEPLPGSIWDNLVFGAKLAGVRDKHRLEQMVEESLRAAQLWNEVCDRLRSPAGALSGGQQQRLCIARAIALNPEVVLLDEPCSGLDPISTLRIEEMMGSLKSRFTWVIVTNNTKQAARVSDRTAFFLLGELVENGPTHSVFTSPSDPRTADYLEGRFG